MRTLTIRLEDKPEIKERMEVVMQNNSLNTAQALIEFYACDYPQKLKKIEQLEKENRELREIRDRARDTARNFHSFMSGVKNLNDLPIFFEPTR